MSGLISKVMTDGSTQLVGQVPGSKFSTLSISVHNLNAVDQEVVLYLTTDATPKPVDTVEPGAILPAKGSARYEVEIASPGEKLFIKAPAGLAVRFCSVDEQ